MVMQILPIVMIPAAVSFARPEKIYFRTVLGVILQIFFIFSLLPENSFDKTPVKMNEDSGPNIVFKQGIFTFVLDPEVDVDKLAGRISLRKIAGNQEIKLDESASSLSEAQKNLLRKFYVVFMRVQDILNMHPGKQIILKIRVYHDSKTIKASLSRLIHRDAPAYYNPSEKTLFISAKKVDEYILAHELAHVIISNYFLIEPPVQTQEILAIYCDEHLKE